jgi:hypothetical protein
MASVVLRLTPIPLLHFSPSTKPQCAYENHCELSILLRLRLELLLDLFPQALLHQNPGSAGLLLLSTVHLEWSNNQTY